MITQRPARPLGLIPGFPSPRLPLFSPLMRILLLGFGTVGQALAALLVESREHLLAAHGLQPTLVGVVDSKSGVLSPDGLNHRDLLEAKRAGGLAALPGAFPAPTNAAQLIAETDADCLVQAVPSNLS